MSILNNFIIKYVHFTQTKRDAVEFLKALNEYLFCVHSLSNVMILFNLINVNLTVEKY